jgi:succinate dehydrogenase/fumarate reductase cytochrome b subunit
MTKPRRPESRQPPKASAAPQDFTAAELITPNPPRRRPWLLALSAIAMILWLLFLAWMAWDASRR